MQTTDIPSKFNIPFASSAGGGFIRTIPQTPTGVPGQASLQTGFPPENFEPVAAGGVPPFGQDFNGVINQMSAWDRWVSAGGTVVYDSVFATAIGGYPKGARLIATSYTNWWVSCVDNNLTNPDTGGAGWISIAIPIYANDTGTTDALAIATNLPLASWAALVGVPLFIKKGSAANTTSTPTLTITANAVSLGAKTIVRSNSGPLNKFDLVNGGIQQYFYDGTNVQVMDPGGGAAIPFLNRFTKTTAGTFTFTALVTGPHRITLNGSGGSGGSAATGASSVSGGGSGGGQAVDYVYLTAGTGYTYVVGAGGAPTATGNNNGLPGGNTTFSGPAGVVTAIAGAGGLAGPAGAGIGGGGGSGVSTNGYVLSGGAGFAGSPQIAQGGQGGPGAGFGAQGGQVSFGGGNAGTAPGGGGSGCAGAAGAGSGGAGGDGQFIIEW